MNKVEKLIARKVMQKLITKAGEYLPQLLEYSGKYYSDEKKNANFQPGEIETLFPVIDYDKKIFRVLIFRANPETMQIEISRIYKEVNFNQHFKNLHNPKEKEKLSLMLTEKIDSFLDGEGEEKK